MKRIGTALLSFIVLASFFVNAGAQVISPSSGNSTKSNSLPKVPVAQTSSVFASPVFLPSPDLSPSNKGPQPLAIHEDSVSYFQDTTGGNWWLTGYHYGGPYHINLPGNLPGDTTQDSIGPIGINVGTNKNGTEHDTTAYDTTYERVMGLRVTTPTDITASTIRVDSAAITFVPFAMSSKDSLIFWVVPIEDVGFYRGTVLVGTYPIPDLFSTSNGYKPIAKGFIKGSDVTLGQLNTLTASFVTGTSGGPLLGKRSQFGICIFDDGPDFVGDTIAYQFDANVSPYLGAGLIIDTDGTQNPPSSTGNIIPMLTYIGDLDAGHLVLTSWNDGATQVDPAGVVGGMSSFWGFDEQTAADPTQAFEGNIVLVTYMHGTTSGVDESPAPDYSLAQNYPNPVSTSSDITYNLATSGPVTLKVYNALGEEVETVVNGSIQGAGQHQATFNAGTLPDGMYYYKLQSGEFTATQSLVVAR